MGIGIFKRIGAYIECRLGGYSYGPNASGVGVRVSEAMAKNFGLPERDISDRSFAEFITSSVGGVNGRNVRHGEELLFLRADRRYSLVSYAPSKGKKRGYLREKQRNVTNECPPLSLLPNFDRLCAVANRRAGELFFVARITPHEGYGIDNDYACIAEFFDLLRKRTSYPSVIWIGGRNYVIIISPEERKAFAELCKSRINVDGREIPISVAFAQIPPEQTTVDRMQKLAFCAEKLSLGVANGKYDFDESEYFAYRNYPKKNKLENLIDSPELVFSPVVSVRSGQVKYYNVLLKDEYLPEKAIFGGAANKLDSAIVKRLSDMILKEQIPRATYCVPIYDRENCGEALAELAKLTENKIYAEIRARVARHEPLIASKVRALKKRGIGTVLFDPEIEGVEFSDIRRAGFDVIKLASKDKALIADCSDFCRMFLLDCAVTGVASDEEFIELRRLGVDLCEGEIFSAPTEFPGMSRFAEPKPEIEVTEQKKRFDIKRFALERALGICGTLISMKLKNTNAEPERDAPEPEETLEGEEKLEFLEPEESLEYAEGIGAKKKRRELKLDFAKRRRQKKEIKKGRLKKLKKLKSEKRK